jgi:predicted transcriptional regulator
LGRNHHNNFGAKDVIMKWMSSPGPERKVSDKQIIEAIKSVDAPFASTVDVANRVGLGRQGALDRLHPLRSQGVIKGKKAGNGWGWWVR